MTIQRGDLEASRRSGRSGPQTSPKFLQKLLAILPNYSILRGDMKTKHQWLQNKLSKLKDDPKKPWRSYPCLLWPFAQKGIGYEGGDGYGSVYCPDLRKPYSVSREAWRLTRGTIPDGLHVLHRCDVRNCFRPSHLFLGTTLDNLRDCSAKGRMHPGEKNGQAKLTEAQVRDARVRLKDGESQRSIARSFGIHYNAIWKIAHGLKWKLTV